MSRNQSSYCSMLFSVITRSQLLLLVISSSQHRSVCIFNQWFALCSVFMPPRKIYRNNSWILKQNLSYSHLNMLAVWETDTPKALLALARSPWNIMIKNNHWISKAKKIKWQTPESGLSGFMTHLSLSAGCHLQKPCRCHCAFSALHRFSLHLVASLCQRCCVSIIAPRTKTCVHVSLRQLVSWDGRHAGCRCTSARSQVLGAE